MALLELNKKKAELEFRKTLLQKSGTTGEKLEEVHEKLERAKEHASAMEKKLKEGGVDIIQPFGRKIAEFNSELKQLPTDEIINAMKTKTGDTYRLLAERGEIIKSNYGNRANIAKISILVADLDGERKIRLFEALWRGGISERISLTDWKNEKARMLAKLISRTGVKAGITDGHISGDAKGEGDVSLQLSNRKVWVSSSVSEQLTRNLERIKEINPKIQLKTAEKQIRILSDDEEEEFVSLQGEYLKLLKEQDALLKEYEDEESISFSG